MLLNHPDRGGSPIWLPRSMRQRSIWTLEEELSPDHWNSRHISHHILFSSLCRAAALSCARGAHARKIYNVTWPWLSLAPRLAATVYIYGRERVWRCARLGVATRFVNYRASEVPSIFGSFSRRCIWLSESKQPWVAILSFYCVLWTWSLCPINKHFHHSKWQMAVSK